MAVLAVPAIVLVGLAVLEAVAFVGSALVVAGVIHEGIEEHRKKRDEADAPPTTTTTTTTCPREEEKKCPQCVPPVGTLGWRLDLVPPSKPHWPCTGSHVHWYLRQQNPKNCQCFWKPEAQPVTCLDDGVPWVPPPGTIPM